MYSSLWPSIWTMKNHPGGDKTELNRRKAEQRKTGKQVYTERRRQITLFFCCFSGHCSARLPVGTYTYTCHPWHGAQMFLYAWHLGVGSAPHSSYSTVRWPSALAPVAPIQLCIYYPIPEYASAAVAPAYAVKAACYQPPHKIERRHHT